MDALLHRSSRVLAGLFFSVGMTHSNAASFDCTKASTQVEYAICGNPTLSALDEQLSRTYRQALAQDPQVRSRQLAWLRGPREQCSANVVCLTAAYQQQLDALNGVSSSVPAAARVAAPVAAPVIAPTAPAMAADNPIPILFDPKYFYNVQGLLSESAWRDPQAKLFGKPVLQWDDADFEYLKYRLEQQKMAELQEARNWYAQRNLQNDPTQDSTYRLRTEAMQKVIDGIPRFKYWIAQANGEQRARHQAQQLQAQAEQQATLAREQAQAVALQEQHQQTQLRQESQARGQWLLWTGLLLAAILGGFVWHRFIRHRCPSCKSLNFDCTGHKEMDRFKGRIKVHEKNSRGTNTRFMSTTFVINRYDYECAECDHAWSEKRKEELGA